MLALRKRGHFESGSTFNAAAVPGFCQQVIAEIIAEIEGGEQVQLVQFVSFVRPRDGHLPVEVFQSQTGRILPFAFLAGKLAVHGVDLAGQANAIGKQRVFYPCLIIEVPVKVNEVARVFQVAVLIAAFPGINPQLFLISPVAALLRRGDCRCH